MSQRRDAERELDEELRAYVDLLIAENIKAGMSPDEARRRALLKVGSIEYVKDQVRDERPGMFFENAMRDLRHGARLLGRSLVLRSQRAPEQRRRSEQPECAGRWPMSDESDMPFSRGRVAICAYRAYDRNITIRRDGGRETASPARRRRSRE